MTRSIVITGASKGIGRAAAEALVAAGWEVIGVARHAPANFDFTDARSSRSVYAASIGLPTTPS